MTKQRRRRRGALAGAPIVAGVLLGGWLGWATAAGGTKTAELRAWDVLALGPWLAVVASRRRALRSWERFALAFAAGATITHNARNAWTATLPR